MRQYEVGIIVLDLDLRRTQWLFLDTNHTRGRAAQRGPLRDRLRALGAVDIILATISLRCERGGFTLENWRNFVRNGNYTKFRAQFDPSDHLVGC